MIRDEIARLSSWEERHRRLVARISIALGLTFLVDLGGAVLTDVFERNVRGGDIHGFGDALFFSTVQLLTISSQIQNPLTVPGRFVDVGLQIWALAVVAAVAGSFAAFFQAGDRG